MADWIWTESPGTALEEAPRVRVAQFGDGYQQRAPDGINNRPQKWTGVYDEVDDAVADEMVAFLRTANGVAAFDYVPKWQTTAIKVICATWRRTVGSTVGASNISCDFEQVFEP